MVCVGYEADNHVEESPSGKDKYGSVAEYQAMWKNVAAIFYKEGASNAVFVMDYSGGLFKHFEMAQALWPAEPKISWLFWNTFGTSGKKGECANNIKKIYGLFEENATPDNRWNDIPWGLGAWGTRNETYDKPPKPISLEVREDCINGTKDLFCRNGDYRERLPRLLAANFYDGRNGFFISQSSDLLPTFKEYQQSPPFLLNDWRMNTTRADEAFFLQ